MKFLAKQTPTKLSYFQLRKRAVKHAVYTVSSLRQKSKKSSVKRKTSTANNKLKMLTVV